MEIEKEVRTIQVDYKCPKCSSGFLRVINMGSVLTTHPPQIPHRCDNPNCDYGETFSNKSYPYIKYE